MSPERSSADFKSRRIPVSSHESDAYSMLTTSAMAEPMVKLWTTVSFAHCSGYDQMCPFKFPLTPMAPVGVPPHGNGSKTHSPNKSAQKQQTFVLCELLPARHICARDRNCACQLSESKSCRQRERITSAPSARIRSMSSYHVRGVLHTPLGLEVLSACENAKILRSLKRLRAASQR